MNAIRISVALGVWVLVSFQTSLEAGCGPRVLAQLLSDTKVAAVFRGTVTDFGPRIALRLFNEGDDTGHVARMRVARVWKGDVPAETRVHVRVGHSPGVVVAGGEYLVIAHVLDAADRRDFGLPPQGEPALAANVECGVTPFQGAAIAKTIGDAAGQPAR